MPSELQLFAGAALLSMGVACIVSAALLAYCSTRARVPRAAALVVLGVASLVALPFALGMPSVDALWGDLLWPMLFLGAAAAAGAGAGAALVYVIVGTR
jgi:hypothetical protein